jgi:hypothetical protein
MRFLGLLEGTRTFSERPARFRSEAQKAGAGNVVVSTDRPAKACVGAVVSFVKP